jgi:hypothetical protein
MQHSAAASAADPTLFETCGKYPRALVSFNGSVWPLLIASALCPQ